MSSRQTDVSAHREQQARALRNRASSARVLKNPARPMGVPAPDRPALEPKPPRERRPYARLLLCANLLLLLVIGVFTLYYRDREKQTVMELCYVVAGQESIREEVTYGDKAALRGPAEVRGFTFLGWEDESGSLETRAEFPVYRDTVYTARLIPAFRTERHIPYLLPDEEGMLHPNNLVSVREFVRILSDLLDLDRTGAGRFLDVAEDDDCFEAAALLKDLGILEGSMLHPDEPLRRGEMIRILCRFYPDADGDAVFQDLDESSEYYPYFCAAVARGWIPSGMLVRASVAAEVTRGEFARIMNRVLGRDAVRHLDRADVGTVLDLPPSSDCYDALVEASIVHTYRMRGDEELWITSEALPIHEPGPLFSGVKLHYIAEDGNPVAGAALGGLTFNQNDEITSGDKALDEMLWEILEETVDPETMEPEEMLRAVYDYVVHNFRYRTGGVYERGAEGWAVKEATRMLRNSAGNCYCFAALFYELARFVGYDAKLYSGIVYGEQQVYYSENGTRVIAPQAYTPHGWVEIEFDGVDYIFDTEFEYRSYGMLKMFKADNHVRLQYAYLK